MRATGIVRRIDDLGRVVIPRELRRAFMIQEGDPLEFFTDEERIILRKYDAAIPVVDMLERVRRVVFEDFPQEQAARIFEKIDELKKLIEEGVT
mgnify:CR=1 FL=1